MKTYSILFSIAYLILTFALGSLAEALQIDAGVSFNIAATIGAGFIAARWFVKQERRQPSSAEVNAFAWQGLLGVWVASIILTIIAFTFYISSAEVMALLAQLSITLLVVVGIIATIVISLLYYFVIRSSFLWFSKISQKA